MELTFVVKKIISAFIMPLPLGLILLFIGLLFLYKNYYKHAKLFLTVGFIWISLFGYSQFSNMLLKPLETQYCSLKTIPKDIKYIVLLGGDRFNRAWEALRLYNIIPNSKIITSGYAWGNLEPEASRTARQLEQAGIHKQDIIVFKTPKDTKEEAIKIKEFLADEPFILITSASHMPRSMAIFKNEGLNPIAAPTAFLIKDTDRVYDTPNGYSMYKSDKAWHEYLGLIWSKLKGYL